MLHTPAQSIGSIVPLFGGGNDGGGSSGQTQDHQTPAIIVGNELAGDTIFVCDILDPGDGTGLALALSAAQANGFGDVFFRRGEYFIEEALDATPFETGALLLRGESASLSLIVVGSAAGLLDRRAIVQTSSAEADLLDLRDFGVYVYEAQDGSTGASVLDLKASMQSGVTITFESTDATFESLLNGFRIEVNPGNFDLYPYATRNCHVIGGPSYVAADRVEDGLFASFQTEMAGMTSRAHRFWEGCQSMRGADVGWYGEGAGTWVGCRAEGVAYAGWSLLNIGLSSLTACYVDLGYSGQTDVIMPAHAYGFSGSGDSVTLTNCYAVTGVSTESEIEFPAYEFNLSDGIGSCLSACYSADFTTSVFIGAGETDVRVTSNANYATFLAIDDNGTGSEIALNINYP